MECLQLKLKKELFEKCMDYNKDIDEDWLTDRIKHYVTEYPISFQSDTCKHPPNERCTARLWKDRTGLQCTHKRKDGRYCIKHNTMLNEHEVLRFGDIREDKPMCDLIKLKNGKTERLDWLDPDPLKQLQSVLNQQKRKVILSAPKLIVQ